MKKLIALCGFVLLGNSVFAQEISKCGIPELVKKKQTEDPHFLKRIEESRERLAKLSQYKTETNQVYIIPVVFHVLHMGGGENITNAQIEDAVRILNVDYRKLNPDTVDIVPEFKAIAADIEIEFRLATIDPDGNCTNGIIRHYTSATNFDGSYAYSGVGPGLWDPQKYMNIYVCKTLDVQGAAAYTYIPGWLGAGNPADAIVSLHSYVGSIGTSSPLTSRTLTHEVGHWLGLDHVWGGTNSPGVACGDDGVADTPITKGFGSCMLNNAQICTPGVTENVQNYMEYSYCDRMFTLGQKDRMRNVILTGANAGRDNIVSSSNLAATGITTPMYCIPEADFITVNQKYSFCSNQQVQFMDNTLNAHPTSWNWSFPGADVTSSTDSMPIISYASPGIYAVSYTATNSAGTGNITKNGLIMVFDNVATYSSPFYESFETVSIPGTDWWLDPAADAVTWQLTNAYGATGSSSAMIDNFNNDAADVETLFSPSYDLAAMNTGSGLSMTFKLAYQQRSASSSEKLQIYSSVNCGQAWTLRYNKTSSALTTVSGTNANAFYPTSAADWRTETVAISGVSNQSNVLFKFVYTNDANGNGNSIFIDDINITQASVGISALSESAAQNILVYPNPASKDFTIGLNLEYKSNVELSFFNVLGEEIKKMQNGDLEHGEHKLLVDLTGIAKGIYFVKCKVNGISSTKKIVIE